MKENVPRGEFPHTPQSSIKQFIKKTYNGSSSLKCSIRYNIGLEKQIEGIIKD